MSKFYNEPKKVGRPRKTTDSSIKQEIQDQIISHLQDEYTTASRNMQDIKNDFDDYYNMIHCVRTKKPNEWESDIYLPEFLSRILTQIGNFVARYFASRDFVEVDLITDDPVDIAESKASKKLLNSILNMKDNHYYQKVVRLMMFAMPVGYGIIKGGYKQKVEQELSHHEIKMEHITNEKGEFLATDGGVYMDPYAQQPLIDKKEIPVYKDKIIEDRPIFDVYPTQDVLLSPEYVYSLQDKEYIIFQTEQTLDQLYADKDSMGYFNLDALKEEIKTSETNLGDETYGKGENFQQPAKPISPKLVICERWGKYPVVVTERINDIPIAYKPGIDKDGEFIDGAENLETIITFAKETGKSTQFSKMVRFQVSKNTKRPMVRFLCYVDALKDAGFGDGEVVRELQTAINDNYNLMNYRTKLAVTPSFKAKRFAGIDSHIRITPEEAIFVENMDDLQEFKITDDIRGSVMHQGLLSGRIDYAMATSPIAMGHEPERRETATAASIVNERMNVRLGMKNMNFEFIGFTELYDMLLTLCNDFMLPETLENILGQSAYDYNPSREDKFRPVSQALETEESKGAKVKNWIQILGMIVKFPNPKTPLTINYILGQALELMGGDFKAFKKYMFSEDQESNLLYELITGGKINPATLPQISAPDKGGSPKKPRGGGPQNQGAIPQSNKEQATRAAAPRQEGF